MFTDKQIKENKGDLNTPTKTTNKSIFEKIQEFQKISLDFVRSVGYNPYMFIELIYNLEKVKANLLEKRKAIDTDIAAIDDLINKYRFDMALEIETVENNAEPTSKKLSTHVIEVLQLAYPKSLKAKQIIVEVVKRGYRSNAKNFEGAMFAMLSNLVKSKRIDKTDVGLYRALKPKLQ